MATVRLEPDAEIPGLKDTKIKDFWAWAYSDILTNVHRGIFAEFIVAEALGISDGVRSSWESFDLLYGESKIEVKSSAYLQSWPQEKLSIINWGIEERLPYDPSTNTWGTERIRSADCYVFCLYTETSRKIANVLDSASWKFYVVSTDKINLELGKQRRVGLRRIRDMIVPVSYPQLNSEIDQVLSLAER